MKKGTNRLCPMPVLISLVLMLTSPAAASEKFYTVQTGTYTPASLHFAKKQANTLSRTLTGDERDTLRIVRGSRYYIVRFGRFENFREAKEALEKIRDLVPDAFILKEEIPDRTEAISSHEEIPPVKQEEPSQPSPEKEISKSVPEEYYTLQIGNFLKIEQAQEEFDSLVRKLSEKELDTLRIEKVDKYYSVRIGKFETYAGARELLGQHDFMTGAGVMKGYMKDEQVVIAYRNSTTPASPTTDRLQVPAQEAAAGSQPTKQDGAKQKEEMDTFFQDVSNQYFNQQYGKAAELLRKGISQWPDNPDLYAWYGATLLNMSFPENALDQYKKAVEISPDIPDYHAGVGHSLLTIYMNRAKESIGAFKKALEIDPNNVSALEGLGFAYASIGKKDLASEIHTRLSELDENAATRLYQAITQGVNWGE